MSATKRKAPLGQDKAHAIKRARPAVLEYHEAPTVKNEDGSVQWPAPRSQIDDARELILESAHSGGNIMIVPDKDADGLSAGSILRHTLRLLGVVGDRIQVHLLTKGNTVHSEPERDRMALLKPDYIFVIDQGSRSGPPLIDAPHQGLVIDHHFATESDFPQNSRHVTACHHPPVATSSLLTYHICEPLHAEVTAKCDWLCIVGTQGDLGNTLKWQPPFPDMTATFKKYKKKTLGDVVSLVNAPRRTATYDVISAWEALSNTEEPASILTNARLLDARAEVNAEVERCTHTAPKFSSDGKVAVFRIKSEAQVHPVIATRWAGHLQSNKLEIVMVANEGYLEGLVNFSCRIARCARSRDPPVNIIESLKAYASLPSTEHTEAGDAAQGPELLERMGENFARGHVQASGGIVAVEDFDELMRRMEVGVKKAASSSPNKKKKDVDAKQKNTLMGYFQKKGQ
ncbi:Putative DHH phosphoesterase superfamily [Septoria linicola]|uniref:DHH phosphoesterase superfamily n=1 Tax=Septoria linicola TaxID=215465 RepID=A0A9Q9ED93_9PEZI|nr:putative DHH phosphoesterase superfamily [Septoria linicola]USW47536.1 Putative DHH phosphoesterase superfamily [Septoria linicola]